MIEKYLVASCLSIIDDFNEEYGNIGAQTPKLREIANEYMGTDLVFKIGYFFGHRATFERTPPKDEPEHLTHFDITVESKKFKIEVKFLKGQKSAAKNDDKDKGKNKAGWNAIKKDFDWLQKEIEDGRKGKSAFVIGWFNSSAKFNELMQLGVGDGRSPQVGENKEPYFPFITFDPETRKTDTVQYIYKTETLPSIKIPNFDGEMNCTFLGNQEDIFHIVIYY